MKPENYSLPGYLVRSSTSINGPVAGATYVVTAFNKQVECAPIVKGDHVSPNPWHFATATRTAGQLSSIYGNADGSYTDFWSGNYAHVTDNLDDWSYDDVQLAAAQAYSEMVENIRGSTDISVDLAQMSQTVATPAQMRDIIQNMRKIHFLNRKLKHWDYLTANMKALGEAWLLWRYGVQPTLQTVYDSIGNFADHYSGFSVVYHGKGAVIRDIEKVVPNWPDSGGWTSKAQIHTSTRVHFACTLRIPENNATAMARYTSLNPASIAWELMPWSFVIDWFYNIGDYLRNMESAVLYHRFFEGGFRTVTNRTTVTQKAERSGTPPPGVVWSGTYRADADFKSLTRVILSEMPYPPAPTFQTHLGSGRLLNAAALLTNFLK